MGKLGLVRKRSRYRRLPICARPHPIPDPTPKTRAAELLGISRRTLINRLERYGLPRPRKGMPE
jgi:hypothetical protein